MTAGRLAVVTGAASGIGAAVAQRLTSDGYVCAGIDTHPRFTPGSFMVKADVSDADEVHEAFAAITSHFGQPVGVLVCSAGVLGTAGDVADQTIDEWKRVIDVNLTGVFVCCRAVIAQMRAAEYGRVVLLASIAGKEGNPGMAAYSAAKAGVIGFTKALAKEVATCGVTVNAVAPALVRTSMVDGMDRQLLARLFTSIPMQRLGEPDEIASAVSYLVNEATYTTGAVVDASGGRATY